MAENRYNPKESEAKWRDYWDHENIYGFDPKSDKPVFSVDTPPPYVSAAHLHMGHVMSYSQAEFVVRFRRMQGYNVFYPMGFDDNGLPTERFVEKKYKIDKSKIDRKQFVELCLKETKLGAQTYKQLWKSLGISVDWALEYSTINPHCQKVAQHSFLDLYQKGLIVRRKDPMIWCTSCQTALAQADVDMEERDGTLFDIQFQAMDGKPLVISTTRPELIPACVALYVNPEDERYKGLIGKKARVPMTGREIPVLTDATVEKDFGTGLMMVCTWGDAEDVRKWREHQLDSHPIIGPDGVFTAKAGPYQGQHLKKVRTQIVEDLKRENLVKKEAPLRHNVGVHERCGTGIDFYEAEQWFIRVLDFKDELLGRGEELKWYPKFMHVRYSDWVQNLKWDWCISRSRFYGVPFPVWYCKSCKSEIVASPEKLPVDPTVDAPPTKTCPKCGGMEITPETDVMDTWMTSSLTPLINAHWPTNKDLKDKLYPMSLRVQAFEIIRTWLFYTVLKSHFHTKSLPWKSVMISGWGLDAQGKKISKSAGNYEEPLAVIERYSADAVRYWAAGSTLGRDTRYTENDVKEGSKLVTKLWNAYRFVFDNQDRSEIPLVPLTRKELPKISLVDRWMLSELQKTVKLATDSFEACEYSQSRNVISRYFWMVFCDNYLELVKGAVWGKEGYSAEETELTKHVLRYAGWTVLRLFAPFVPFISEELYSRYYKNQASSIHVSPWPTVERLWENEEAEKVGIDLVNILSQMRRFKTERKLSPAAPLGRVTLQCNDDAVLSLMKKVERELLNTLRCQSINWGLTSEGTPSGEKITREEDQSRFQMWVATT